MLHHLFDPLLLLRRVRKFLSGNGKIYLRSFDDDEIIAYPDENFLIRETLTSTYSLPGMLDCFHGRKLYSEACKAGYKDIRVENYYITTVGMDADQRYDFFFDIFIGEKTVTST